MIKKFVNKLKKIPIFLLFSLIAFLVCIYFKLTEKTEPITKTVFEKESINEKCEKSKEDARKRIDDLSAVEISESYGSVIDEIRDGQDRFREIANDIRRGKYRLKDE